MIERREFNHGGTEHGEDAAMRFGPASKGNANRPINHPDNVSQRKLLRRIRLALRQAVAVGWAAVSRNPAGLRRRLCRRNPESSYSVARSIRAVRSIGFPVLPAPTSQTEIQGRAFRPQPS